MLAPDIAANARRSGIDETWLYGFKFRIRIRVVARLPETAAD
ncbi:hypothetical protein [Paracidovorax wautersii]|uniref:Uncharacterized protein n=1 Tax=Paracidovorax wautersii TaxID=1177982 RepID=A0ABU1IDH7_9BURK|nr:hypothetical protein [Paracidovorax wautersii]MDR6215272.1 hypothetical protein [Paracidovorax wautersii]